MRPLVAFSALLLLFSHTASGAEISEDMRFEEDVSLAPMKLPPEMIHNVMQHVRSGAAFERQ